MISVAPETEHRIRQLIDLSLDGLATMRNDDGLFCEKMVVADSSVRSGISLRYSLISLIGLVRAENHGYPPPVDLHDLWNLLIKRLDTCRENAGDLGLFLWANTILERDSQHIIIDRLQKLLDTPNHFRRIDGMERSWVLCGLSIAGDNGSIEAKGLLDRLLPAVITTTISPSGLFYHTIANHWRKRYPNFATQVYCTYAFTLLGQLKSDDQLIRIAKRAADQVCRLQLSNGAWPWIFDARRGNVVERYQTYSVHQDAMAPMMLLPLYSITKDERLLQHVLSGLNWIYNNELGVSLVDHNHQLILRSIRRKTVGKLFLYVNTFSHRFLGSRRIDNHKWIEINNVCCPYHLGWILEAWCQRFPKESAPQNELDHV